MMRPPILTIAALLMLPVQGLGQTLGPNLEVVGRVEAEIDGEKKSFFALRDTEAKQSDIVLNEVLGKVFFDITAQTLSTDGLPGAPTLTILLGPDAVPPEKVSSVTLTGADSVFMAYPDAGGTPETADIVYTPEGGLGFSFSAKLVEMAGGGDTGPVPLAGGRILMVTGRFEGTVPLK